MGKGLGFQLMDTVGINFNIISIGDFPSGGTTRCDRKATKRVFP